MHLDYKTTSPGDTTSSEPSRTELRDSSKSDDIYHKFVDTWLFFMEFRDSGMPSSG